MKKIVNMLFLASVAASVFAAAPVVDYSTDIGASHTAKSFPMKTEDEVVYKPQAVPKTNLNMEQRIGKLERQINHLNEQNMAGKIEELQQRLQKLNGQFEDQAHQIEQLNVQLKGFYQDLNQRLDGGKAGVSKHEDPTLLHDNPAVTSNTAAKQGPTGIVPAADNIVGAFSESDVKKDESAKKPTNTDDALLKEQQMYQTAIDLLPDKKYEASESKLRSYLKLYSKGIYVANAHYWLGEINFLQKNFDAAEEEFKIVVDKYATSRRISDAMFKLALVHQHQGRDVQAKQELKQIIKRYSGTSAAQLAKQQLAGN